MNRTPEVLARFEFFAGRWYADYPDADSFNDTLLHSQRGIYGLLCGDPKLDEIVERARTESDPRMRRDDYAEIEELLQRDALLLAALPRAPTALPSPRLVDSRSTSQVLC
jgi:ABC-type oligopeptide transport system substrate-binding subunit